MFSLALRVQVIEFFVQDSRSTRTMDGKNVHTNCLIVQFEPASKPPSDKEIFDFFRKRTWTAETLSAMFRAPREHCVYVKFRSEEEMKKALLMCPTNDTFLYENGSEVNVSFATAKGSYRYVRVFGLPIEVDSKHVATVLSKYGKVHHIVRERYNPDTGYPILNGVRGVQMEISKDIPAQIYIDHFQVRVSYEGMPNRCFVCNAPDHVKADCPKRPPVSGQNKQNINPKSYVEALIGKKVDPTLSGSSTEPSKPAENLDPELNRAEDGTTALSSTDPENGGLLAQLPFSVQSDGEECSTGNTSKKRGRVQRKDSAEPPKFKVPRAPVSLLALQSLRNRLPRGEKKK